MAPIEMTASNVPMIYNLTVTSDEKRPIDSHCYSRPALNGFRGLDSFTGITKQRVSLITTCYPCILSNNNDNLSGPQKNEILFWLWKLVLSMYRI